MNDQLDLFDILKADALERVETNANAEWLIAAYEAVRHVARTRREFTSAEVLAILDATEITTHDKRALGPVMLKAKRLGLATPTGVFRTNTTNPNHHGNPDRVWRSEIYGD